MGIHSVGRSIILNFTLQISDVEAKKLVSCFINHLLLSVIVMIISLLDGKYLDAVGFAISTCILTFLKRTRK